MKRKRLKYSPDRAPNATRWSALGEEKQIELVVEYHRRVGAPLPNANLHAGTHVVIENQILLGDETPVEATLQRLMREGLSRHDAIHAIGSVLAPVLFELLKDEIRADPNLTYFQQLRELTANGWLTEYE